MSAKSRAICPCSCSSAGPACRASARASLSRSASSLAWTGSHLALGLLAPLLGRQAAGAAASVSSGARSSAGSRAVAVADPHGRHQRGELLDELDLLGLAVRHQHQDALDLGHRRQGGEGILLAPELVEARGGGERREARPSGLGEDPLFPEHRLHALGLKLEHVVVEVDVDGAPDGERGQGRRRRHDRLAMLMMRSSHLARSHRRRAPPATARPGLDPPARGGPGRG